MFCFSFRGLETLWSEVVTTEGTETYHHILDCSLQWPLNLSGREKPKPQYLYIELHCLEARTGFNLGFQFEHICNFYFSKLYRNITELFFSILYVFFVWYRWDLSSQSPAQTLVEEVIRTTLYKVCELARLCLFLFDCWEGCQMESFVRRTTATLTTSPHLLWDKVFWKSFIFH